MVRRLLGMATVVKNFGCGRPAGRTSLKLAEGAYEVAYDKSQIYMIFTHIYLVFCIVYHLFWVFLYVF